MILKMEPERGGEAEGIIRFELSLPISPDELIELRHLLARQGWEYEAEEIDTYLSTGRWEES